MNIRRKIVETLSPVGSEEDYDEIVSLEAWKLEWVKLKYLFYGLVAIPFLVNLVFWGIQAI